MKKNNDIKFWTCGEKTYHKKSNVDLWVSGLLGGVINTTEELACLQFSFQFMRGQNAEKLFVRVRLLSKPMESIMNVSDLVQT